MVQHSPKISELALAQLKPVGLGLEVSPYFDPFLSKTEHNVLYTDYIGTEEIRAKAAANPDLWGREIPAVDFVWTPGASLADCAPAGVQFDYVVASHVMEHVPNPVGWLNEVLSVMKVGGRLALFLPDRRFNADYFRQETGFPQLVQWWMEQPATPTPGQILDFMTHSFSLRHGAIVDWSKPDGPQDVERAYSDAEALSTSIFVHNEGSYVDIHCTVWNALTFKGIFEHLISAGLLDVTVGDVDPEDAEFCVVLTKRGESIVKPPAKHVVLRGGQAAAASRPADPSPTFEEPDDLKGGLSALRKEVAALTQHMSAAAAGAAARSAEEFEHLKHVLGVLRHDVTFVAEHVASSPVAPPEQSPSAEFEHLKHMLSVVHHDLSFLTQQVVAPGGSTAEPQHIRHVLDVLQHDLAHVAQQVSAPPTPVADMAGEFEHLRHTLGVLLHDLTFLTQLVGQSTTEVKGMVANGGKHPAAN